MVQEAIGPWLPAVGMPQQDKQVLFNMLDANRDGKVTREEVPEPMRANTKPYFDVAGKDELTAAEWLAAFQKLNEKKQGPDFFSALDRNKDGSVTIEEIDETAATELNLSGVETKSLLDAMRQSGKRAFTRQEINQLIGPMVQRADRRRNLQNVFRKLDVNKDGKISVAEAPKDERADLERFLSSRKQPLSAELTEEQFFKLLEEAIPSPQLPRLAHKPAAFQVLDVNRDGFVSPDELLDVGEKFSRLDVDRDNQVSLDEFVGEPGKTIEPEPEVADKPVEPDTKNDIARFVSNFFDKFDKDKNGKLTKGELSEDRINNGDYDDDGAMSRAELTEYMSRRR